MRLGPTCLSYAPPRLSDFDRASRRYRRDLAYSHGPRVRSLLPLSQISSLHARLQGSPESWSSLVQVLTSSKSVRTSWCKQHSFLHQYSITDEWAGSHSCPAGSKHARSVLQAHAISATMPLLWSALSCFTNTHSLLTYTRSQGLAGWGGGLSEYTCVNQDLVYALPPNVSRTFYLFFSALITLIVISTSGRRCVDGASGCRLAFSQAVEPQAWR